MDADVASASDDDEVSDSCDILPPHVRSTSSTGGELRSECLISTSPQC